MTAWRYSKAFDQAFKIKYKGHVIEFSDPFEEKSLKRDYQSFRYSVNGLLYNSGSPTSEKNEDRMSRLEIIFEVIDQRSLALAKHNRYWFDLVSDRANVSKKAALSICKTLSASSVEGSLEKENVTWLTGGDDYCVIEDREQLIDNLLSLMTPAQRQALKILGWLNS